MADEPRKPSFFNSLSARLLVLTIGFVMLAEILIYAPSVARYRRDYLEEKIARAHLATLTLEAMPERSASPELRGKLLAYASSHTIVLRLPERSVFALGAENPPLVEATFDLRKPGFLGWIAEAFEALAEDGNRVLRIIGPSPNNPRVVVEVTLDEEPLRAEMYGYSQRILGLSIVISAITAGLLFLCLQWLMVGPMRRIIESMNRFRADPERENPMPAEKRRGDEIGLAQRELETMQSELRQALKQKERLAALGSAMAKINHDLRNSLATAVLVTERLSSSQDADVKRYAPRLYAAIDRAVQLCAETLSFVSEARPKLAKSRFPLAQLADEVGAGIKASELGTETIEWDNRVDDQLEIEADREQLHRALVNVGRNAFQAGAKKVHLSTSAEAGRICIDLADDGPGLSEPAREHLFQPFAGSTRKEGTGLGLIIVRDVMCAHGGDIKLIGTGAEGTIFRLELPAPGDTAA